MSCTNVHCVLGPPKGQGTNGACHCLDDVPRLLRLEVQKVIREERARATRAEQLALEWEHHARKLEAKAETIMAHKGKIAHLESELRQAKEKLVEWQANSVAGQRLKQEQWATLRGQRDRAEQLADALASCLSVAVFIDEAQARAAIEALAQHAAARRGTP